MKKTILAAAALVLVVGFAALSQTSNNPKYQVVFQLTEPQGQAWDALSLHVNNLRTALSKDGVQVEVVFFWPRTEHAAQEEHRLRGAIETVSR